MEIKSKKIFYIYFNSPAYEKLITDGYENPSIYRSLISDYSTPVIVQKNKKK